MQGNLPLGREESVSGGDGEGLTILLLAPDGIAILRRGFRRLPATTAYFSSSLFDLMGKMA
jgi:hypothetical protein